MVDFMDLDEGHPLGEAAFSRGFNRGGRDGSGE